MDKLVMAAVDAIYIVAIVTPFLLVIIYRWKEVPRRYAEIKTIMDAAFESTDPVVRDAAQKALANNPYMSKPKDTFENFHRPWRYVLPLIVLLILTASSAYVIYSWTRSRLGPPTGSHTDQSSTASQPVKLPNPPSVAAEAQPVSNAAGPISENNPTHFPVIIMALAGGYVWAVFQIFARVRASELSPADLYEIDLGIIAAVPVGIAFSLVTVELDDVRAFMAFAASAFPLREVWRMIRQYTTRKMLGADGPAADRPTERHLGSAIEGLSDQELARLSEIRITTILDMAYCDPVVVMLQTGFPLPWIIDWMDQSIWALYVGDLKAEINGCGIRCSLDVCEFVDLHLLDANGKRKDEIEGPHKEALDALSRKLDCPSALLLDLLFRIYCDPQVVVLRRMWYPRGVPAELRV